MDLMECMEILFSLFEGFARFRLCLKHFSKDLHGFSPTNFTNLTNIYRCVIVFFQIIWMLFGGYCFWVGDLRE